MIGVPPLEVHNSASPFHCDVKESALSPVFATDPRKPMLTSIIATLPEDPSRKSFICHTCNPLPLTEHWLRGARYAISLLLSFLRLIT
jgi:hypothetical protein